MAKTIKLYVTVTELLGVREFDMITDVDPDLPWSEFITAINLHKRLDKEYPDWQGYDINIDEEEIVVPNMFGKLETPSDDLEDAE